MDFESSTVASFAVAAFCLNFLLTVFWMMIAWRAMSAHEKMASLLEEHLRRGRDPA